VAGRAQAMRFDWDTTAQETLAIYLEMAEKKLNKE